MSLNVLECTQTCMIEYHHRSNRETAGRKRTGFSLCFRVKSPPFKYKHRPVKDAPLAVCIGGASAILVRHIRKISLMVRQRSRKPTWRSAMVSWGFESSAFRHTRITTVLVLRPGRRRRLATQRVNSKNDSGGRY